MASGHPWVFAGDVLDAGTAAPGDTVTVVDPRGRDGRPVVVGAGIAVPVDDGAHVDGRVAEVGVPSRHDLVGPGEERVGASLITYQVARNVEADWSADGTVTYKKSKSKPLSKKSTDLMIEIADRLEIRAATEEKDAAVRAEYKARIDKERAAIDKAAKGEAEPTDDVATKDDLDVAREGIVLQAVVGDQDVDVGMQVQQMASGLRAPAPDDDGTAGATRNQQGFVADVLRARRGQHFARRVLGPAVAARDHARPHPGRAQLLREPDRQWGLAGAADEDIADDNDWNRQPFGFQDAGAEQDHAQRGQQAEQQGQRPQRDGQRPAPEPGAGECRFERRCHVRRWLKKAR